jgi:large subunit ribosomal protein L9
MQVILTEDVANLGRAGDLVRVKPGYARNYLVPRGLALHASSGNVALVEHKRRAVVRERERLQAEHRRLAEALEQTAVTVARRVGPEDRLFGAVTAKDVAEALMAQNIQLDRKLIQLGEPIRTTGTHEVVVRFDADTSVVLRVNVVGI